MNNLQELWEKTSYSHITMIDVIRFACIWVLSFYYMINPTSWFEIVYSIAILLSIGGLYVYFYLNNVFYMITQKEEIPDDIMNRIITLVFLVKPTPALKFIRRFSFVFICCTFYIGGAYAMLFVTSIIGSAYEYYFYKIHQHVRG